MTAHGQDKIKTFLRRIEDAKHLNLFIGTYPEEALLQAKKKDAASALLLLSGKTIGLKDLFCYKDHPVSAASAILKGFVAQINATCVERLVDQGGIIIGHQNCDEFGMGARNEHSAYGPACHPQDPAYSTGGSSGASCAAVAAELCEISLGTDTGGSIRQPASWCGTIGFKPTYGRISRYGVIEFASSLDTVGITAGTIKDCARTLEAIAGFDPLDYTSSSKPVPPYSTLLNFEKKARLVYFKEALEHPYLAQEVRESTVSLLERLKEAGHQIYEASFPLLDYALPTYYTLTTAEASANLARYDGLRYGQRSARAKSLEGVYRQTRAEMLGGEVKRRIVLGTLVLCEGYHDAYYVKAQKIRRRIKNQMERFLEEYDFIVGPTSPTTALKHGSARNEPLQEYLGDLYTIPASLAGLPAISIPNGRGASEWPIGFQVIGKEFQEASLFAFAQHLLSELL